MQGCATMWCWDVLVHHIIQIYTVMYNIQMTCDVMYNIHMTCDAWMVGSESTVLAVTLTCHAHDEPIFGQCLSRYSPNYETYTWCFTIKFWILWHLYWELNEVVVQIIWMWRLGLISHCCLNLSENTAQTNKCNVVLVLQIIGLCRLGYLLVSSQSNTCGGASVVGRLQHPLIFWGFPH